MRRVLTRPVTITGRNVFGLPAYVALRPIETRGVWWQPREGAKPVLISHTRLESRAFHCIALSLHPRRWSLHIPEHLLGILCAAGMDGLMVQTGRTGLPYDGCAKLFWEALEPASREEGELLRYTPNEPVEVRVGGDSAKSIQFLPDTQASTLRITVTVDYADVGTHTLSVALDEVDLALLAASRPWGRTWVSELAATICGTRSRFVWFDREDHHAQREQKLTEVAWHRILDLLGALLHAFPSGGMLVGTIESMPRVGHAADVRLVQQLHRVGVQPVRAGRRLGVV